MYNFFYSLIYFIIAIFFILLGIVGVMIPWSDTIRSELVQFIQRDALVISLFGFAFVIVGFAIAVNIIINARRSYYLLKSGDNAVMVDEQIIQQYLTVYWKQLFPNYDTPCRLRIKKNRLHLTIELPYLPTTEQPVLLERIKQELRDLFASSLGYHDEFQISASFQPEAKK